MALDEELVGQPTDREDMEVELIRKLISALCGIHATVLMMVARHIDHLLFQHCT